MNTGHRPCEISLDQAAAGMTLAAALLDDHGGVLLPQDAALTDSTLAALRRRGVARCVVWTTGEPVDPAELERARAARLARLDYLFRHCAEAGGSQLLLQALRGYRAREQP